MSRMSRYEDEKEKEIEEETLSRTNKNQDMYKEVYLNNKYVDINNLLGEDEEEKKEPENEEEVSSPTYEEKSYDVNDYLKKAHERLAPDNAMRNLDNEEFIKQENEISKLIQDIEQKRKDDNLFSDLLGDDENTIIEGQLKTQTIVTTEYTYDEFLKDNLTNDKLQKALSDETLVQLKLQEDKENEAFQDVLENKKMKHMKKKIPIIVFSVTLFILIIVVIAILLFK